jgi:phosphatidate cytidylyltransferase
VSGFLSRVVVVLVGAPIVLGAIWLGGWWLFALVAAGVLVALHEFYAMARPMRPLVLAGYCGGAAMLVGAQLGGIQWMVGGFVATPLLAFLLYLVASTRAPATAAISATVLGAAWIGFGLGFLVLIRDLDDHGRLVAFAVVIAVWVDDTVAYLVGRAVGRHKFSPAISPAKTWEGFLAGTAGGIFAMFVALYDDRSTYLSIPQAIVLGAVVAVAAALGDLFESAFKRDLQVKDSGRVLAGHGGVLDRVDAFLFAFPAAYFALALLT